MKQIADLIEGQALFVLAPDSSVRDAAVTMAANKIGAAAVVEAGKLVGIFSERDIMSRVVAKGLDPEGTAVQSVMSKELLVADPSEDVDSALQKMHSIHARHLPVVADGKLVGMISIRDLLEIDDQEQRKKASFLSELVTYSPDYES
jgi:CBS domain-containing protein